MATDFRPPRPTGRSWRWLVKSVNGMKPNQNGDVDVSSLYAPLAHHLTHEDGGTDEVTLAESQITGLVADLALKAPLASPTFTGDPKAPTASPGDNDTSLATTAFVTAAITAAGGVTFHSITWIDPTVGDDRITLAATPVANSVRVHRNGLLLRAGSGKDYTLSGTTITILTPVAEASDVFAVEYETLASSPGASTSFTFNSTPGVTTSGSAAGTSITLPATIAAGSIILIGCGQRAAGIGATGVATGGATYTPLGVAVQQSPGNSNNCYVDAWSRTADGSEGGTTFSITTLSANPVLFYLILAPPTSGSLSIQTSSQIAADSNVTSKAFNTVTTTDANELIVYIGAAQQATLASLSLSAGPTVEQNPSAGGRQFGLLAWEVKATAGVTTARTMTTPLVAGIGGWTVAVKGLP